jgi:hypothetical protein
MLRIRDYVKDISSFFLLTTHDLFIAVKDIINRAHRYVPR